MYGRVCYGVTGKISFLTISLHSQLIRDAEVHAPTASCFFDVFVNYRVPVFGNVQMEVATPAATSVYAFAFAKRHVLMELLFILKGLNQH